MKKNKTTAGLLAIFLGTFGVHKFYLGNIWIGVVYFFFMWTYIPTILGIIEGIIYLRMKEDDFNNKFNKNNDIEVKLNVEYDNNYDVNYGDYHSFVSINGEKFDTQENNKSKYWYDYWEKILLAYKEITIKLEQVKEFGNLEDVKSFEKDLHIFFKDRVLGQTLKEGFIDKIEPNKEKVKFDTNFNRYYDYFGRKLTEEEMMEAKRLFMLEQEWYKKQAKDSIYDLYSKSLRRIGNIYKKYKEWELALSVFNKIKEFGFDGITDGKSIVKCEKELSLKNQKKIL